MAACTWDSHGRREVGVHCACHLPRRLLSRWSKAAWRCHQKSLLWQPWRRGRQIKVRLGGHESPFHNACLRTPPFPAQITHGETFRCLSHERQGWPSGTKGGFMGVFKQRDEEDLLLWRCPLCQLFSPLAHYCFIVFHRLSSAMEILFFLLF